MTTAERFPSRGIWHLASMPHLRHWTFWMKDAHGLYRQFGFAAPLDPERAMEHFFPDVYKRAAQNSIEE